MGHFSDLSIDIEEADNADTNDKSNTEKILSVGDIIGTSSRSGIVKNISISMDSSDVAGDYESAVDVKSYDMELWI